MSAAPSPVLEHADAALLLRLASQIVAGGVLVAQVPAWVNILARLADGTRAAVEYAGSDCPLDALDELLLLHLVRELEDTGRLHGGPRLARQLGELAGRLDRWCDQLEQAPR